MVNNICRLCKNNFIKNRKRFYCTKKCRYGHRGNPKTIKKCWECDKDFKFYKSIKPTRDAKWCSLICRKKWNSNPINKIQQLKKIFEQYVVKKEGCWDWSGSTFKAGYGQVWFLGKQMNASRASWIIHFGLIKNKLWVLHRCDNPVCTNPDHLFLGTCKDNVKDMILKGRKVVRRGSGKKNSKLDNEKIFEIRKLINEKVPHKEISKKFSISLTTISMIKYNRIWKHVT